MDLQSKSEIKKCKNCHYFKLTFDDIVPSLQWEGEIQGVTIIRHDHEGICEHESNWRPSRGEMPCDMDYHCKNFELVVFL